MPELRVHAATGIVISLHLHRCSPASLILGVAFRSPDRLANDIRQLDTFVNQGVELGNW
jgi:hypothetical protein